MKNRPERMGNIKWSESETPVEAREPALTII